MPVVCFASPKGGVGKTTLAANIGFALARGRPKVLLLDLDVQNSLRLHFGVPLADRRGLAGMVLGGQGWPESLLQCGKHLLLLPFGSAEPAEAELVHRFMAGHPGWLVLRLEPFLREGYLVVADTPPGPSPFLDQVLPVADLRLAVLMCDPASVTLLPLIEQGRFCGRPDDPEAGRLRYLFNQVDLRRRLTRDVLGAIQARLGERVLGIVHADEAYAEAAAYQRTVIEHAAHSRAANDLMAVAGAIEREIRDAPDRLARVLARMPPALQPVRQGAPA